MSASDQIAAARDEVFASRVAMLLMVQCIAATNESALFPNHGNRLVFAQKHMKAQINTKALAAAVIGNSTAIMAAIDANPTLKGSNILDADITTQITALYNSFSNAYAAA